MNSTQFRDDVLLDNDGLRSELQEANKHAEVLAVSPPFLTRATPHVADHGLLQKWKRACNSLKKQKAAEEEKLNYLIEVERHKNGLLEEMNRDLTDQARARARSRMDACTRVSTSRSTSSRRKCSSRTPYG